MLDVPQLKINNMKDLILITAYCPDNERENILRKLVTSLEHHKDFFEIIYPGMKYNLLEDHYLDKNELYEV